MATVQTIMTADESGSELISFAQSTAGRLVHDDLKRSKIRNIFTEVRRIEALWDINPTSALRRLNMLKPKMDYHANREPKASHLRDVLGTAIDIVNSVPEEKRDATFKRFMELFEAILAYHHALGGEKLK